MVTVGASKFGHTDLIFVDPGDKDDAPYCYDFIFQQYSAQCTGHASLQTITFHKVVL